MSLTGTPLFVVLILATVLATLATLLLWSKIPGPRPLRWLSRVVMIALCQLTAVSVVLVWINQSYGLYASWDDWLGRDNGNVPVAMPGPPPERAKFIHGDSRMQDTYFHGAHSKLSGQVMIWTPPQYDKPEYRKTKFPVVTLLHGVPGSPQSWLEHGGMPKAFDKMIREDIAKPAILVIPIVNPGGVDTDCSNTPGRKVATWLTDDVPDLVRHHFRTESGPKSWGLAGISTGAYCAAKLPLQFPKVYGAGVALDPDPLTGDPDVIPDPVLREHNSPTYLVRHSKADVSLFLATSQQDRDSPVKYIKEFSEAAKGSRVKVKTEIIPTGGHNYNTWQKMYPVAFNWLSQQLKSPVT
ncbi:alpha/beta hydrolase [Streptomyces sp. NPDC057654]|uniref:alpha/beta hydrolase n=1 Tax=Streptomyces sp. NPDC057654 TaxID=3346196 RepID=UPI0036ADA1DE